MRLSELWWSRVHTFSNRVIGHLMEGRHKQLSGENFKTIGGGLVKEYVERKLIVGDVAIIPPLNIRKGSVKLELLY